MAHGGRYDGGENMEAILIDAICQLIIICDEYDKAMWLITPEMIDEDTLTEWRKEGLLCSWDVRKM